MSFLPTGLLLVANRIAVFAPYNQVSVNGQQIRFVDPDPAADSPVAGKTWSFVNQNGSPDRRYRQNPELSISEIGEVKITMPGAAVEFHVSNPIAAREFVEAFTLALTAARGIP